MKRWLVTGFLSGCLLVGLLAFQSEPTYAYRLLRVRTVLPLAGVYQPASGSDIVTKYANVYGTQGWQLVSSNFQYPPNTGGAYLEVVCLFRK